MYLETIKKVIADITSIDPEEIKMESMLKEDLEIDSLDAVEIGIALEEELSMTIPQEALETFKTVQDIENYIEANK